MMNESILRSRQIRNFFGVKVHFFTIKNCNNPPKTEPQSTNEVVYTPKSSFFRLDNKSTEHLRRDDVETRPFLSKIHGQITDSPRIPLIDDFGRNRRLRIPIASVLFNCYTANAKYRCELFAARRSNEPEPLVLSAIYTIDPPPG